jgi:hypothetical protein
VYVVAVPCQVGDASSDSSTWKLNDTVPATTIIAAHPKLRRTDLVG